MQIRLLTADKGHLAKLLAAVEAFDKQNGATTRVRVDNTLHDRFVFIDESRCFQTGASLKDGAVKSDTTITQFVDIFDAVYEKYQERWRSATVAR